MTKRVVTIPDGLALEGPYVVLEVDVPVDAESPFVALRVNATFASGAASTTIVALPEAPRLATPCGL